MCVGIRGIRGYRAAGQRGYRERPGKEEEERRGKRIYRVFLDICLYLFP